MVMAQSQSRITGGAGIRPWLRRMVITLGPLQEWRGVSSGQVIQFESDGTPGGLKVTAGIKKTIMGMPGASQIAIYNLARDTRDAIRGNLTKITLQVGWQNTELHTVFSGSVMSAISERTGSDIVTKINALPGYGALVRGISSKSYGPGMPVKDVVKDLAKDLPGLTIADSGMEGIEGKLGSGGWCCAGSTKDAMTQLANEFGFSWNVDNGKFKAVGDKAVFGGMTVLDGKDGGLISVVPNLTGPMQIQTGVKIKAIYVPGVTAGSTVRIRSEISPKLNGDYRVSTINISLDAYSDQWTMDIESFKARV